MVPVTSPDGTVAVTPDYVPAFLKKKVVGSIPLWEILAASIPAIAVIYVGYRFASKRYPVVSSFVAQTLTAGVIARSAAQSAVDRATKAALKMVEESAVSP